MGNNSRCSLDTIKVGFYQDFESSQFDEVGGHLYWNLWFRIRVPNDFIVYRGFKIFISEQLKEDLNG